MLLGDYSVGLRFEFVQKTQNPKLFFFIQIRIDVLGVIREKGH
jgi:hypothetical protein